MLLALDDLGARPRGPDGFADAAERSSRRGVALHPILPGRDDPRRVAPDLGHVEELDLRRVVRQFVAQHRGPRLDHRDEHRLAAVQAFAYELRCRGDELLVPGVQQRLVPKAVAPRPDVAAGVSWQVHGNSSTFGA